MTLNINKHKHSQKHNYNDFHIIVYIMFGYFIDDMLIDIFIIEFILCNLNILFSRCCNRISNINEGRLLLICLLIVCGFDPCLSCWTRSFLLWNVVHLYRIIFPVMERVYHIVLTTVYWRPWTYIINDLPPFELIK